MPRPCSICESKARNEIDRHLLEMTFSGTSIRGLARKFGVSEDSLARHRANHLGEPVADVLVAMKQAREQALADVKLKELESIKAEVSTGMAARLLNCANSLDQLSELRTKAANLLELAETDNDLRAAAILIREIRWQIRVTEDLKVKRGSEAENSDNSLLDAIERGAKELFDKYPLNDPLRNEDK